jgi:GT2 family glycosyltransferase
MADDITVTMAILDRIGYRLREEIEGCMMREIELTEMRAPARVLELEVTQHEPDEEVDVERYASLWCLVRCEGIPQRISMWDVQSESSIHIDKLRNEYTAIESPQILNTHSLSLTVAICTHERPVELRRALLSLQRQVDRDFTLLIVDNAPSSQATSKLIDELELENCTYVIEPRLGLSRARNKATLEIRSDLVACIDDDEVADPEWTYRIKQGFSHERAPAAIAGMIVPAELEHEAQIRFEQYGGFNKGRTLDPQVLHAGSPTVRSPLYPLPSVGSGGNMAFRMEALRRIGKFDERLGAGTRTHAGEETRAFASLLRNGETVLYWPQAITWHFHRKDMEALQKQFFGYSAGLSAFLVSMIRSNPSSVLEMVRLAPQAFRDLFQSDSSLVTGHLPDDFPRELIRSAHRGLAEGAFRYLYETMRTNP